MAITLDVPTTGKPLLTIEDALDLTRHGKFNIFIVLTGGFTLLALDLQLFSVSYVLTSAQCELKLDLAEQSIFLSANFIGIMSTQFIWGFLSDTYGRRPFLISSLTCAFLTSLGSAFSGTYIGFIIFRFFNGMCVACISTINFPYLCELVSRKNRSKFMLCVSLFAGVAFLLGACIAWLILANNFEINLWTYKVPAWRLVIFVSSLPTVLACMLVLFLPESPKFLISIGKHEETINVLEKLTKSNKINYNFNKVNIIENDIIKKDENIVKHFCKQTIQLFNSKYALSTIILCVLQFGIYSICWGIYIWYPYLMNLLSDKNESDRICVTMEEAEFDKSELICDDLTIDSSIYMQNIYIGLASCVGYLINIPILKLFGFKVLLFGLMFLAGMTCLLLNLTTNQVLINIEFVVMIVAAGISVCVVNAAIVQIYPTQLRAMGLCISLLSGQATTVLCGSMLGFLFQYYCFQTFYMISGIMIVCSILVYFLPSQI